MVEALEERRVLSTFFVSTAGLDVNPGTLGQPFRTIRHALNVAVHPGDTVEVRGGIYKEKVVFSHSGSAQGGFITLEAYPGEHPVLDGLGVPSSDRGFGNDMVQMVNLSYLRLIGFEIRNDNGTAQVDASGVHMEGFGSHIEIRNNVIHDILGIHAMGISIYGSSVTTPISNLIIAGNTIYHCQPADSETLTLNGNVTNFQITGNVIHDVNNIGIDMIGGEADIFGLSPQPGLPVTRNGLCSHNVVYNVHANYGGGFAGGIYVDGGQNITLADNVSYQNDLGLEVGAENPGYVASGIVVENNLLYFNTQGGLVFGGFDQTVGRVRFCKFINNTAYMNDTTNTGFGQVLIGFASNNTVTSNIFYATSSNVLMGSDGGGNVSNLIDHNVYFAASGANSAQFNWNATTYGSFSAYRQATGEDAHSLFANPLFANAGARNFHLSNASPAIDAGSSIAGQFATTDFGGLTRGTPPDCGAYENPALAESAPMIPQPTGVDAAQNIGVSPNGKTLLFTEYKAFAETTPTPSRAPYGAIESVWTARGSGSVSLRRAHLRGRAPNEPFLQQD
jgi:hypothetical protein